MKFMVRAIQLIGQIYQISQIYINIIQIIFSLSNPQGSILEAYNVNVTLHSKIITSIQRSAAITIVTWSGKTVSF